MVGICALKPNVSGKYPIFISSPYFLESLIPIIKLRIKDSSSTKNASVWVYHGPIDSCLFSTSFLTLSNWSGRRAIKSSKIED